MDVLPVARASGSRRYALSSCLRTTIAACEHAGRDCRHCPPMPPEGLAPWLQRIGFYRSSRTGRRLPPDQIEKYFLARIIKHESGCWIWTGLCDKNGFPLLNDGKSNILAHRWAFVHWRGQLARSRRTTRSCGNRRCVNPDHVIPSVRRSPVSRS